MKTPSLPASGRSFGYLFTIVFSLAAVYVAHKGESGGLALSFGGLAVVLFVVSRIKPGLLVPLRSSWYALGLMLGRIVSPFFLGAMFFVLITPIAIVTRIAGRDVLRLRRNKMDSYWVDRERADTDENSFKNQF